MLDTNQNGQWDEGEPLNDTNGNGVWDGDLFIDCENGICEGDPEWSGDGNGIWDEPLDIKTDRVVITVKAEQNNPPVIEFSNALEYSEDIGYFIYCDIDYQPESWSDYLKLCQTDHHYPSCFFFKNDTIKKYIDNNNNDE